jgi:uncharacterized repeat protein (TIGR03803 family)
VRMPKILHSLAAVFVLLLVNLAWGVSEKVLYTFDPEYVSAGGLVLDGAGNLYGTTYTGGAFGFGTVFELSASAEGWTESVLHNFTGDTDGKYPSYYESLVFDTAGNLYGSTRYGGSGGAIFKLTPNGGNWTLSVIKIFKGGAPECALVFDTAGNLYGTTGSTAFELSPGLGGSWTYRVLHVFGPTKGDGAYAHGALVFDTAGNLYGTTKFGGGVTSCGSGCGTVFKFTPASGGTWRYRVIYRFKGGTDGKTPYAGVISDPAGNLYGTTTQGGNTACNNSGCGIVFKLSPNSNGTWTETKIHVFTGLATDGAGPFGWLILDHVGNLFGTTVGGGSFGYGTVFELVPRARRWTETLLHSFAMDGSDGVGPFVGLISDSSGNLYGTTRDLPVAYEVTP